MSNDVYGFVATRDPRKAEACLRMAASKRNIGIAFVASDALYNFPETLLPSGTYLAFVLGNETGKISAQYLTDGVNYAPGYPHGLPSTWEERFDILFGWIEEVAKNEATISLAVALTECSEIESHMHVRLDDLREQLWADFQGYAPPNKLYIISK